ncbi:MAG: PAS domain-containing hybrid sensor histidine kinase/response regulator, partial [Chthoniobacterales bacterium]
LLIAGLRQHELTEAAEKLNAQLQAEIAERKASEVALRESEERFRVAALAVSNLVWTNNAQGMMEGEQPGWAQFTGQTREEYQGHGWVRAVHPDDTKPTIDAWNAAVEEKRLFELEHRVRRHDGAWRSCSVRAVPVFGGDGEIREWVGVHNDITERKQAEEALRVAMLDCETASLAKDDFLAALSHELRTPLTPVLLTATALEVDPALPLELRDQVAMMRRNIELEARLIDDLLDLTRISKGKLQIQPTIADLHELLEQTAEIVSGDVVAKQVPIHFAFAAARHHVMGDPARLQQVFWNVMKNALKFTPAGGSVTVRTRNDEEGRIVISVTDTGIGIRAEALSQIFEAFEQGEITFQQRFGGLGLGLAISRAIVELHGGEISAQSDGVGHGATFSVTLAAVDAPKNVDLAQSTPPMLDRMLRLLVVDDHEATLAVLTRLLTRSGHHITPATSVGEGLAAAKGETFDAVISDLGLPDGTGFELMEKLRAAYGLRGIALSGYGMDDDLRRSQEAGFGAHLTKPIDFAQLERALEELMAGSATASASEK